MWPSENSPKRGEGERRGGESAEQEYGGHHHCRGRQHAGRIILPSLTEGRKPFAQEKGKKVVSGEETSSANEKKKDLSGVTPCVIARIQETPPPRKGRPREVEPVGACRRWREKASVTGTEPRELLRSVSRLGMERLNGLMYEETWTHL